MINIMCVKWGDKYSAEFVNKLFNMVEKNICGTPFTFYCYTDNGKDINPSVKISPMQTDLTQYWPKLELFKLFRQDTNIFFDKYDYVKEHLKLSEVEISEYTGYKSNFINNNSGFLIKSGSNETMTTHQTFYYHVYMVKDLSKGYYDRKNWKEYYIQFVVPLKKEREKKKRSLLF